MLLFYYSKHTEVHNAVSLEELKPERLNCTNICSMESLNIARPDATVGFHI